MKRVIEVSIKDGLFCHDDDSECTFLIMGNGGLYQYCCLYNEDLKPSDEGVESSFGTYRIRKCMKCI